MKTIYRINAKYSVLFLLFILEGCNLKKTSNCKGLPNETWVSIMSYIKDKKDICNVKLTNKDFYSYIKATEGGKTNQFLSFDEVKAKKALAQNKVSNNIIYDATFIKNLPERFWKLIPKSSVEVLCFEHTPKKNILNNPTSVEAEFEMSPEYETREYAAKGVKIEDSNILKLSKNLKDSKVKKVMFLGTHSICSYYQEEVKKQHPQIVWQF